jgi:hypothetical protein
LSNADRSLVRSGFQKGSAACVCRNQNRLSKFTSLAKR